MPRPRRLVLVGAASCLLASGAATAAGPLRHAGQRAHGAQGDLTVQFAGGSTGCLVWLATPGCEQLRGVTGGAVRDGRTLTAMAMSPDGTNLYLTAEGRLLRGRPTRSSSVIVLRRRADTGAMQQLGGPRGCLTLLAVAGCSRARAIDFPVGVMVSPDGRFVYTAASSSRGAAIFARDRQSGALRQLPGRRGCLRHPPGAELCAYRDLGRGVNSGFREWSQLSPDGRFVYGFDRPLRRDVRRGGLSPTGDNGCRLPCRPGTLAFAPGAREVYLLSYDRYAVHGLRINRRTGALARMPRAPRCWPAGVAGCGEVLGEVANIGIAPDGRHVYVTLGVRDVVIRFTRRASGLLSRGIVQPVCGGRSTGSPCPAVTLGGLEDVVFAPDGRRAYAMLGDAVVAHSRDPTGGELTSAAFPAGCVSMDEQNTNCGQVPAVAGSYRDAIVSPDGRFLYLLMSGGVVGFRLG